MNQDKYSAEEEEALFTLAAEIGLIKPLEREYLSDQTEVNNPGFLSKSNFLNEKPTPQLT